MRSLIGSASRNIVYSHEYTVLKRPDKMQRSRPHVVRRCCFFARSCMYFTAGMEATEVLKRRIRPCHRSGASGCGSRDGCSLPTEPPVPMHREEARALTTATIGQIPFP
jgi:hypothetical protein